MTDNRVPQADDNKGQFTGEGFHALGPGPKPPQPPTPPPEHGYERGLWLLLFGGESAMYPRSIRWLVRFLILVMLVVFLIAGAVHLGWMMD